MIWRPGGARPRPDSLESGERVLAGALGPDGEWAVAASRSALHLRGSLGGRWVRQPWHELHSAGWNAAEGQLTLRHRGPSGHLIDRSIRIQGMPPLVEVLRERIASTVVVQRSLKVVDGTVHVVVRRVAGGSRDSVPWCEVEHGEGVNPANPQVRAGVAALLAQLQEETGAPALARGQDYC